MSPFRRRPDRATSAADPHLPEEGGTDLEEIRDVLRRAALGNLDVRVVRVPETSPHAGLAYDLNHLLDLVDAYLRESEATLAAAAQGNTYRKFLLRGMLGAFANNARQVNAVAETLRDPRRPAAPQE